MFYIKINSCTLVMDIKNQFKYNYLNKENMN